jgi:hypothetical protein
LTKHPTKEELNAITDEILAAVELPPPYAFNGLWVALVKMTNLMPTVAKEPEQVAALLRKFSRAEAASVVEDPGVETLLSLDPPLETVFGDKREQRFPLQAAKEFARVRDRRVRDPKGALVSLVEVLLRIRNKREHGFKIFGQSRDEEILEAGTSILRRVLEIAPRIVKDEMAQHRLPG